MKFFGCLCFVLILTIGQGQSLKGKPSFNATHFKAMTSPSYYRAHNLVGLIPDYRVNNGQFLGLSYTYAMASDVGIAIGAYGLSLGIDKRINHDQYSVRFGMWAGSLIAAVLGADIRFSYVRHFIGSEKRVSSLRPEIGLALGPIFFNYAYDIFPKRTPELGKHNFIVTTYIPLFVLKTEGGYPDYYRAIEE